MNKKFNKIFAIIMCFIVILSSACSNNKGGNDKKESEKSKNTKQENKKMARLRFVHHIVSEGEVLGVGDFDFRPGAKGGA